MGTVEYDERMYDLANEVREGQYETMLSTVLPGVVADKIEHDDDLFYEAIGAEGILRADPQKIRGLLARAVELDMGPPGPGGYAAVQELGQAVVGYVRAYLEEICSEEIKDDMEKYL